MTVDVVHWNPRKALVRGRIRVGPKINNFGDLLGPIVVEKILADRGIPASAGGRGTRLLAVGSILRLAKDDDTVWGIGANGKSLNEPYDFTRLDVRAVRGPLTREFLRGRSIDVPEVYGDPGLLVGTLFDRAELARNSPPRALTIIPNFHDYDKVEPSPNLVDPRSDVWSVLGAIAASDFVVGSSLHAIIVAESFGIPARLVSSSTEPAFKYQDYYEGSGRASFTPGATVAEAIALGGEPGIRWSPEPLLAAFPADLWR